jgi:hypothetical protein
MGTHRRPGAGLNWKPTGRKERRDINLIECFEGDTVIEDMKYEGESVNRPQMEVKQL